MRHKKTASASAVRIAGESVNGKQAKRLRKIARELELNANRAYAPVGPLRRNQFGAPIRRPFALTECERRAYQEAKAIYQESK